MEGNRKGSLRSRPGSEFKRNGPNKKGKWSNFSDEFRDNVQVPDPSDTVYRILCPSKKIGSLIGKGGGIIKSLREETRAKITVSDSIPRSEERVIMIYSPPDQILKKELNEGSGESIPPHCPAQDALMKVHDRIIEEDLSSGLEGDEDKNSVVTARLLVPNNMVGCLLGKGGDVIQRLRSETGANIRILPAEHLPTCALSTDELLQIQGKPMILKKALYEVSTLLHENPRKEHALNVSLPFGGHGFLPGGPLTNVPPPRDRIWSPRGPVHMPPPPWMDDYAGHPRFMPGGFDHGPTRHGVEPSGEFSMKILCLASKIGGVIGKGGINVRQLEQETGSSISVEDPSASAEERIIHVSAIETLQNPRSQTIDAILHLQNKVSEASEKGALTTRLLIPSSKVGCLLGQGGSIINEMRRRTKADIHVYSKDEKPEFASEDELVQVSGSFSVVKDVLGEIGSRLRARCLRDGSAGAEPAPPRLVQEYGPGRSYPRGGPPVHEYGPTGSYPREGPPRPVQEYGPTGSYPRGGPPMPVHEFSPTGSYPREEPSRPVQEFGPTGCFPRGGPPMHGSVRVGFSGSYDGVKGGTHDYEPPRYPVQSNASRYPIPDSSTEIRYPSSAHEAPGMRMKHPDTFHGRPEPMIETRGGAPPSMHRHHDYSGQNHHHANAYPTHNGQGSYHSMNPVAPQHEHVPYQSPYQNPYPSAPHQPQPSPYNNANPQHNAYPSVTAHQTQSGPYKNTNAQHNAYASVTAHGPPYQY